MKKSFAALLTAVILFLPCIPVKSSALTAKAEPERTINVVYDDSNSMLMNGNFSWCYARYAMQVFATMLGEKDTLNIYLMSSYTDGKKKDSPDYSISGSMSAESRAKKVYDMGAAETGGTPFSTVEAAYNALPSSNDENHQNWLVVLTDGAFDDSEMKDINKLDTKYAGYISGKPNTKIITLAIGSSVIAPTATDSCISKKAATDNDVTNGVADICNTIFSRVTLPAKNINGTTISFDVPMKEVIVFAQANDGDEIDPDFEEIDDVDANIVEVHMDDSDKRKATTPDNGKWPSQVKVKELSGVVATYTAEDDGYIMDGQYELDIENAGSIQVYYKPAVDIKLDISNEEGTPVKESEISEGNYSIDCYLAYPASHPKAGQRITSELIGAPSYEVKVNDSVLQKGENGYQVDFIEGNASVDVHCVFLDYNEIRFPTVSYTVTRPAPPLVLTAEPAALNTSVKTLENSSVILTIQREDKPLDEAIWKTMSLPVLSIKDEGGNNIKCVIQRGEEVSTYVVSFKQCDDGVYQTDVGKFTYDIVAKCEVDKKISKGSTSLILNVNDDIPGSERFAHWLKENAVKVAVSLALLILILGYVPGIKKYLPKRIKKSPLISKRPTGLGQASKETGSFVKDTVSTIIPYKAQTGTLRFAPSGSKPAIPKMRLKAASGGVMHIMNYKDYAGKDFIKFGGTAIEKDAKPPVRFTAGTECRVKTDTVISNCTPTVN